MKTTAEEMIKDYKQHEENWQIRKAQRESWMNDLGKIKISAAVGGFVCGLIVGRMIK